MYEELIRQRIVELRLAKNVSQREMSLSLGQNDSYINRIENGKALPYMQVFLYICEYFNVTPQEFFGTPSLDFPSDGTADTERLRVILDNVRKLNGPTLAALETLTNELADKH